MSIVGKAHGKLVYSRRMNVLALRIAALLPPNARVLDVGCGDGMIASLIMKRRPDVAVSGIDILVRNNIYIPVKAFDGKTMPYKDKSFDAVMFIDVLHHTENPESLLLEAKRVSKNAIILKDHRKNGFMVDLTLRFMDWGGNAHYGVNRLHNYWTEQKWRDVFKVLGLVIEEWNTRIGLYSWPISCFFDRNMHFIAKLGQH